MAKFSINSCVMVVMLLLAVFALSGSAQPPPPPQDNPCRKLTQLCAAYGAYSTCCEGLSCTGTSEDLATGNGFCLPIQELTPSPTKKCKQAHNICQTYGELGCCEGLSCVHPRSLPSVGGIESENLKLPPGLGVCEPIKL